MSVKINGVACYPQSLIDFVKTPNGLNRTLEWLESQKIKKNPPQNENGPNIGINKVNLQNIKANLK